MPLASGMRLGPYEIQSAIGAGGMGEVYKARDTRLDRTVAIKVLPPDVSADPDRRARFEREAKTIAGLSYPHIGPLFDVGDHCRMRADAGQADRPLVRGGAHPRDATVGRPSATARPAILSSQAIALDLAEAARGGRATRRGAEAGGAPPFPGYFFNCNPSLPLLLFVMEVGMPAHGWRHACSPWSCSLSTRSRRWPRSL